MATTNWNLESSHSELTFKVRHMMISNVSGSFKQFSSTLTTEDEDINSAKVTFTIDVDSISTNNDQRDGHLKSEDFFDAANHPQITFASTKVEKVDGDNYKVHGDLTVRGTTKQIAVDVEFGGIVKDPWGYIRAGFTATGKINRKEYGLHWSAVTEAGGLVVSDDVKFELHVEYVKG
jgi:polyisoprenoid-binding protein YceI